MKKISLQTKKNLHAHALNVFENAYAPYSRFRVACAVLTNSGKIFVGVNVENATFGATVCAERSAVSAAIAAGERSIIGCLVITNQKKPWPPCGICRQVLREFSQDATVFLADCTKIRSSISLKKLLPLSFGPESLDVPEKLRQ